MTHSFPFMIENFAAGVAASSIALSGILLATMDPTLSTPDMIEAAIETRLLLVPLMGGIFTMGGAVFLNPTVETIQVKIGRAFIGLFACIVAPQFMSLWHPALKDIALKPIMLLLTGGVAAFLGFIFSRPFVQGLYDRSRRISDEALNKAEKKYLPKNEP